MPTFASDPWPQITTFTRHKFTIHEQVCCSNVPSEMKYSSHFSHAEHHIIIVANVGLYNVLPPEHLQLQLDIKGDSIWGLIETQENASVPICKTAGKSAKFKMLVSVADRSSGVLHATLQDLQR